MRYFFSEEIQLIAERATTQKISYETASWLGWIVEKQFLFKLNLVSSRKKIEINRNWLEMQKFCVKMFGEYLGGHIGHVAVFGAGRKGPSEESERASCRMDLKIRGCNPFNYYTKNQFYRALECFIEEILKDVVRVFGEPIRKKAIKEVISGGDFAIFFDKSISRGERLHLKLSTWKYRLGKI